MQKVTSRGYENTYSAIVDSVDSDFVRGRFVKLKKDNIEKLKKISQNGKNAFEEKLEVTGIDEYIEANAYFVWNLNNNLILAQYNPDSLNVLTRYSRVILGSSLSRCNVFSANIQLEPFPSDEFIDEIIRKKGLVRKFRLSFKNMNKKQMESLGMSSDLIWEIADTDELGLTVSTSIELNQPKTLTREFYNKLKEIAYRILRKTSKYVVYTDEGNFDLIGEKFIYYNETVEIKDTIEEYRKEIYGKMLHKLHEQTEILENIRKLEEQKYPPIDSFR